MYEKETLKPGLLQCVRNVMSFSLIKIQTTCSYTYFNAGSVSGFWVGEGGWGHKPSINQHCIYYTYCVLLNI